MIYSRNTSAAYIIPERMVDILLGRGDMKVNGKNVFNALKFNVGK